MIDTFDRPTVRLLRQEIENALKNVEAAHGIAIKMGNARFSAENVTFKIEAAVKNSDGTVETKERKDYVTYAASMGLDPMLIDEEFQDFSGRTFIITGLAIRRRKNPVLAKDKATGKTYVFPTAAIKSYMGVKERD